jgi:putative membrane protein
MIKKVTKDNLNSKYRDSDLLDPDVRFLLANERTLLAWVRTSLALLAGGLALTQFGDRATSKSIIGIIVILMGAIMTYVGLVRFRAADTAIRKGQLPDAGQGPQLQVLGVIVLAVVLIVVEFISMAV